MVLHGQRAVFLQRVIALFIPPLHKGLLRPLQLKQLQSQFLQGCNLILAYAWTILSLFTQLPDSFLVPSTDTSSISFTVSSGSSLYSSSSLLRSFGSWIGVGCRVWQSGASLLIGEAGSREMEGGQVGGDTPLRISRLGLELGHSTSESSRLNEVFPQPVR